MVKIGGLLLVEIVSGAKAALPIKSTMQKIWGKEPLSKHLPLFVQHHISHNSHPVSKPFWALPGLISELNTKEFSPFKTKILCHNMPEHISTTQNKYYGEVICSTWLLLFPNQLIKGCSWHRTDSISPFSRHYKMHSFTVTCRIQGWEVLRSRNIMRLWTQLSWFFRICLSAGVNVKGAVNAVDRSERHLTL